MAEGKNYPPGERGHNVRLTSLSFCRFAIATFAGIIPASFLLAHFGSELVVDETDRILIAVVLLGVFTAMPFVIKLIAKSDRN